MKLLQFYYYASIRNWMSSCVISVQQSHYLLIRCFSVSLIRWCLSARPGLVLSTLWCWNMTGFPVSWIAIKLTSFIRSPKERISSLYMEFQMSYIHAWIRALEIAIMVRLKIFLFNFPRFHLIYFFLCDNTERPWYIYSIPWSTTFICPEMYRMILVLGVNCCNYSMESIVI